MTASDPNSPPMATPSLRRDLLLRPPASMGLAASPSPQLSQQWRLPMEDHHHHLSRFKRATDAASPVLPTIASLLTGGGGTGLQNNKRKLLSTAEDTDSNQVAVTTLDWSVVPTSNSNIPSVSTRALHRGVYREFDSRGVSAIAASDDGAAVTVAHPTPVDISSRSSQSQSRNFVLPSRHDLVESRLYFNRDDHRHEPHLPAETSAISHSHEPHTRKYFKTSKYHRTSPPSSTYYNRHEPVEEMEVNLQKRRRVTPSPIAPPRQPLYESEYGLAVLETSKPLIPSRYVSSDISSAASRRRYARDNSNGSDKVTSPLAANSRICYNGSEGILGMSAAQPTNALPTPRNQTNVDKDKTTPLTTLVIKSKEFLNSKNLVRNRHDEIDWVATFLKVGFDSSSIYALMCPLRKGRWKSEEENYTMGLLRLIENGTILLRHGQRIRGYIGEKLHSDDMRVLKKLSNCKLFHFTKLINPRLAEEEQLDMSVAGAQEGLERLDQLKGEFLRSVQLEALVAVRKYLSDSSLRDLLNVRA